jgi:hypothetical protein
MNALRIAFGRNDRHFIRRENHRPVRGIFGDQFIGDRGRGRREHVADFASENAIG